MDWLLLARSSQSSHVRVYVFICVGMCGSTPQHCLCYHVLFVDAAGATESHPAGHLCDISDSLRGDTISPVGDARLQVKATAKAHPQIS